MSLFRGLHPQLIPAAEYLYNTARQFGLRPHVTSVVRSRAKQAQLYQLFLAGKMPYTVAPPGKSLHERGLAFDMVTQNPEAVGDLWRRMGGRWFLADPVHFEAG